MDKYRVVIAGGGMVAGYAAKQLAELGIKPGELVILSAESSLPYERPPLSKGFLAGKDTEDGVRISPESFYREHGTEVRLGCRVTAVDTGRKQLALSSGGEVGFDNLILATGSSVRTLTVPGAQLGNVHYLRSLDDSKAIRERARDVKRAVVIGGGFIAMEVASVLAQSHVETTMIMQQDRIWKRFFTPEMSRSFEDYFAARGVRFEREARIGSLKGDGKVESVELVGGRGIPCEMVVAGIGVQPAIGFLEGSGIDVTDGVMVNEYLETNVGGIFAAGDIANYPDILFAKRRRVEHWDNAVSQGQHCAKAVMGERTAFRHVPYFFSDVFDLSYEFWGDPADAERVVVRGELPSASYSVWWLRNGHVVAAFVMRRPDEEREIAPQLIESRQRVSPARLGTASTPISGAIER